MWSRGIRTFSFLFKTLFYTVLCLWIAQFLLHLDSTPFDERFISQKEPFLLERDPINDRKKLIQSGKELNLDLPYLYISVEPSYYAPKMQQILPLRERYAIQKLAQHFSSKKLLEIRAACLNVLQYSKSKKKSTDIIRFLQMDNPETFLESWKNLQPKISTESNLGTLDLKRTDQFFLPRIVWNGTQNRFHKNISNYFKLNFGQSYIDDRPVHQIFIEALPYTLIMNIFGLSALVFLGILLGKYWSKYPQTNFSRITKNLSYFLKVSPSFWLATIFVFFIVGVVGISPYLPAFESHWMRIALYLLFPAVIIVLSNISYISTQVESSIDEVKKKAFVNFAKQRGLPEKVIWRQYILREALINLIPLIGVILPNLIMGALVLEIIFNVPGLGRISYNAILAQNWPLVQFFIIIYTFATIVSRKIADELHYYFDPRTQTKMYV